MFFSSTLLALALAAPDAHAMDTIVKVGRRKTSVARCFLTTGSSVDRTLGSITADVRSDAGSETVDLAESDAWLHGSATLPALPRTDADLVFTVYDAGNAALITFSGTLGADGTVSIADVSTDATDTCEARTGCGDTSVVSVDLEVLAAEAFANPAGGYALSFDLGGADTYAVAYADVRVDEGDAITTCTRLGCTTTGTVVTTTAEVAWDDVGAVWAADLALVHEGVLDVDTTLYDTSGARLETPSVTLASPWIDAGYGVNALATDGDPLTSVALHRGGGVVTKMKDKIAAGDVLSVFSDGWTLGDTLPAFAVIELEEGDTLTIPANSYQVATSAGVAPGSLGEEAYAQVWIDTGGDPYPVSVDLSELGVPVCAQGMCVAIDAAEGGGYDLAVTAYSDDASTLPAGADIVVALYDEAGTKRASDAVSLTFSDEVAVLFATAVSFSADPLGVGLGGSVSLLDAPDAKGKQKTLSKGDFSGGISRDGDGDLGLGAIDRHDVESKGDILIGGEPIDFELTDTDGDGEIEAPPAILLMTTGNGKGTRAVATGSNGKPGLL
ncbi:MAG: hypothetical protein Q8P41_13165 [Pseudomonadota bacterium]|nr:hypothetical protein [Pseudomonadota bacterium]